MTTDITALYVAPPGGEAALLGRPVESYWELCGKTDNAWLNGGLYLDDRRYDVGGGWVDSEGRVTSYEGWEIDGDSGDFGRLVRALGLDPENRTHEDRVRAALWSLCPEQLEPVVPDDDADEPTA